MNVLKKVFFPIISLFLFYRSYEIMYGLLFSKRAEFSHFENFVLAFLINLFITGVFAFLGFAYATNRIFPASYYRIYNPALLSRCYTFFNVELFRKALILVFWGKEKNKKRYFSGGRGGFDQLIYQSKQSEFGHIISFLIITLASIQLLIKGYYSIPIISMLINIIGNLYPVILQRYHRMRIDRIRSSMEFKA